METGHRTTAGRKFNQIKHGIENPTMGYTHTGIGSGYTYRNRGSVGRGNLPSLLEEVSPECVEQIIDELRQDPDPKDIFTAVESEFDQGFDVEIDEDIRLENELLSM